MSATPIVESGMTFGPYPEGHCFYIEKSRCYRRVQEGMQMAEFLLLRPSSKTGPAIWVVEAKSSSPRPMTQPNFSEFIDEIRTKLTHGFLLGLAIHLQRPPDADAEWPAPFKALDLKRSGFRFVLVIDGHKDEWLAPLQSALSLALKPLVSAWALPALSVAVLNDAMAKKHGLISP